MFLINLVKAQQLPASLRFNKYTVENGLCDNNVSWLQKDKKGFLWISTHNGISRFDGAEFTNFRHKPQDNNSLLNNFTGALTEDSAGRIWISTYEGLSMYNPNTGRFRNFIIPEKEFVKSEVLCVLTAKDGSVWFSTWNKINTIDLKTFHITSYLTDSALPDKNNVSIGLFFEDHAGNFWFNSRHGVCVFNRLTHKVVIIDKNSGLSAFYDNGKNKIFFSGWNSSLKEYDLSSKKIKEYFFHNPKFLPQDSVRATTNMAHTSFAPANNLLWVCTEKELCVFDMVQNKFIRYYQYDPETSNTFPAIWPGLIFFDKSNNIWLGSKDGLYVASLNQLSLSTIYLPNESVGEISHVREDAENKNIFWVSVNGGGFFKAERSTGKVLMHIMPGKVIEYNDSNRNYISDFFQLNNETIYYAGGGGITCYNTITGKDQFVKCTSTHGIIGIYTLIPKSDTDCWTGTSIGIGTFNYKTKKYNFYPHYKLLSEYTPDEHYVKLMLKDYDGNIWFYNRNDGFFQYQYQNKIFHKINIPGVKLTGLISRAITQSSDSTVWLAADGQLFCKKQNDTAFHNVNIAGVDNYILEIKAWKNVLYMQTFSGIYKYNIQNKNLSAYDAKDGIAYGSTFGLDVTENGKLIVKGIKYFSEINTEQFGESAIPPPLIFESININSKDSFINFDNYKNVPLHLNYNQNQFTIHFRLMNFEPQSKANYFYKLEGWDKGWLQSGSGNYAAYSNLPGGDYVFLVKSVNADGSENPLQARLMLHIDTPFWKSWWFTVLYILALCAVMYWIYHLRTQRKKAVEKVRAKISRDLHDDVGSALTSINIWSNMASAQTKNQTANTAEYFSRINKISQNTLDNMNDIIWAINPQNDTIDKVIMRMKSYASEILEPTKMRCLFTAPDTIYNRHLPLQYRRECYLIFKEAINNASKYSAAENIFIDISLHDSFFEMKIKDDGKGFDINTSTHGNGLQNMRDRAMQMKASLTINTSVNKGTEIILKKKIT